jgi:branched-chain amino acid aminotransferase
MNYLCLNGHIVPADKPVLMADNRSFRYGDGLFETMKIVNGKISLSQYHFQRFFAASEIMQFEIPESLSEKELTSQVLNLCERNLCTKLARVRFSAFRGNGGIYGDDNVFQYLIEARPADPTVNQLNEKGLIAGIYTDARKSCDKFSNLKSANYLPYIMAAKYAQVNELDDCFVLNVYDRIADASIANIFLIKDKKITTPQLSEGCVNGTMRRFLIENLIHSGYEVQEKWVTQNDIEHADEIFLTNAMTGIRWVKQFADKKYGCAMAEKIYNEFIKPIWV